MKIIFLIGQFHPLVGGAEKQAEKLAHMLIERGHEVEVLTTHFKGLAKAEIVNGIKVERIWAPGFGKIKVVFLILRQILKLLWKDYDVLHIHQALYPAFAGSLAAKLRGKPSLSKIGNSAHRFDLLILRQSFPFGLGRVMAKVMKLCMTRFIAINSHIKRDLLEEKILLENILEIPNGVDLKQESWGVSRKNLREEKGFSKETFLLLHVATLTDKKNHEYLIKTMKLLKGEEKKFQLLCLGKGPLESSLKEKVQEESLENEIQFLGEVSDVTPYLLMADCFLLPSKTEGMSNALLEAMSVGTPCIVSNIEPNREVLGEEGTFCEIEKEDSLRDLLIELSQDNTALETLGQRGKSRVEEYFQMEKVAMSYESLYKELLGEQGK